MSHEYDEATNTSWSTRRRLFFGLIALFVILAMLGGAVVSVIYVAQSIWRGWQATAVTSQAAATEIPATAPPPATATALPAVAATADPNGVNRIVFINERGQVESTDPTGNNGRVLTDDIQRFQFPVWSPDGRSVAVIGRDPTGSGVYLIEDLETDEDNLQEIYFSSSQTPFYLYWSPDSRHITFLANHPRDGIGLHLGDVTGQDSRLLATGSPLYWDWTADSRQILIHAGAAGEDARLALIDVEGDGEGENIAQPGNFQAPGISPSGRYLAYVERDESDVSWLVVIDQQSSRTIREQQEGVVALNWSPTTDQLAYTSGRPDRTESWGTLHVLDAASGDIQVLSRELTLAFFWSPDGRHLSTISVPSNDGTGIQALLPAAPRRGQMARRMQQNDAFQLDLFAFDVASGQGRLLTRFQPTALFVLQFLPFFDQYALSHRLWSPDSSSMVLPMRIDEANVISVVDMNGGQKLEIGEGDMAFWSRR